MNLYHLELMNHYRFPRNKGKLCNPGFTSHEHNPSCGDSVSMTGRFIDTCLVEIAFEGAGCVISQATASLLTEWCRGKSREVLLLLDTKFIVQLIGIELGPTRLSCALLPLKALQQGIKN